MINLYSAHPTSSFVMYPDVSFVESSSNSYRLQLTQSYDLSSASVSPVKRLNSGVPNNESSILIFEGYSGSGMPSFDGQYTAKLELLNVSDRPVWGTAHYLFGSYHRQWGNAGVSGSTGTILAEDRAYVHGTNLQAITTYISPNEKGSYTTYNS